MHPDQFHHQNRLYQDQLPQQTLVQGMVCAKHDFVCATSHPQISQGSKFGQQTWTGSMREDRQEEDLILTAHGSLVQGLHVGEEGGHALLQKTLDIGLSCVLEVRAFLHMLPRDQHELSWVLQLAIRRQTYQDWDVMASSTCH